MCAEAGGVGEVLYSLLQYLGHVVGTQRVEAVAVDHGILRGQTEYTRLGVSFLWERSRAADLDNTRADIKQDIRDVGMFV